MASFRLDCSYWKPITMVLLLVMVLIFALIRFIPGDPADVMLGARATEESRAMLHAKMGIDKPIYEQFFLFMKNCLRLDFGESILSGEPVSQILARRFQVTASLTGMTALFTMLLALPIGYFSGVNKHNAAGKAVNTSALVVMAVPAFWVGILLMYFFGLKLFGMPIRTSQMLAAVSAAVALAALIWMWKKNKNNPSPLYVQRLAAQAQAEAADGEEEE